jgi:hypothetical protein
MLKSAKAEASKVDLIIVGDKGNIFFFTCRKRYWGAFNQDLEVPFMTSSMIADTLYIKWAHDFDRGLIFFE